MVQYYINIGDELHLSVEKKKIHEELFNIVPGKYQRMVL